MKSIRSPWRLGILLVLWAALVSVNAAPHEGPYPLRYSVNENFARGSGHVRAARFQMQSHPTEKLSAEPIYFSRVPQYADVRLGQGDDRIFTAVLDESRGTGSGYDTLYIDGNNNEDMTDDGGVSSIPGRQPKGVEFPVVELAVSYGVITHPYHVKPHLSDRLCLTAVGYCKGKLRRGDNVVEVAVFDNTANGLFNDRYEIPGERYSGLQAIGDTLSAAWRDADRNSICDVPALHYVGTPLSLGAECYEVRVAPHGRSLEIGRSVGTSGHINIQGRQCSAFLESENGLIELRGPGSVKVPAGKYQFKACAFFMEDKKGQEWHIVDRGQLDEMAVEVKAGEESVLRFGVPLIAEIFITRKLSDEFRFDLKIKGQAGGTYSGRDIERVAAEGSSPAPRFKIVGQNGKAVATGQFEYG